MPTWPIGLPQRPLAEGLSGQPEPNVVSFTSDVGAEHLRRRATARRETIACQFIVTDAQRSQFLNFFRETLKDGTLTYEWQDPIDEVQGTYRIRTYRINYETFDATNNVDMWRVSLQLRRLL